MDCIFYTKEEMLKNARLPVKILPTADDVFMRCALDMATCIEENNKIGDKTVIVMPIGPIGQYPLFVEYVNKNRLDLKNVYFILMDAYIENGKDLPYSHRLSLRRRIDEMLFDRLDAALSVPKEHVLTMDAEDVDYLPRKLAELGKIDLCVAGIGINGHIGMNEPQDLPWEEYLASAKSRILDLSIETRLISAIANYKGALAEMPKKGITVGLKEMMTARKMRAYCFRDWHNSCVKRTACGEPTGNYPATLIQRHKDVILYAHEEIVKPI